MRLIGLVRYVFRLAPGIVCVSIAVAVVGAGLAVLQPVLLGQAIGRLPGAARGEQLAAFLTVFVALLVAIALAQVIRTPELPIADALGAAREKDMLLRLNRATSHDPDQSRLDDPPTMSRIRQIWDRQWEVSMGTQLVVGSLVNQVLTLVGASVPLALVLPWWVPVLLLLASTLR